MPDTGASRETVAARRLTVVPERKLRRTMAEDFSGDASGAFDGYGGEVFRRPGVRVTFRGGLLPRSKLGRSLAAGGLVMLLGALAGVAYGVRSYVLHDERFVVPSSAAIQIEGNTHLTRAQLLSVFGEDVDRNIFNVSLGQRRAQLERLPWVQHATVMRLLPNRMRVAIAERTPVAFVREGNQIGLVDASGVLLDVPVDAPGDPHYSFPVVTGVVAEDPQSTRAARMKIFEKFTEELDSGGEKISAMLSEVDLSNPEDVKALIPDQSTDVLVHFGDRDFLDRYKKYKEHLPEWRTQYPKLASVDMRYERQVVLEMAAGTAVPMNTADGKATAGTIPAATARAAKGSPGTAAAKAPALRASVPALRASVPAALASVPATRASVPATRASVPATLASVPATRASAPAASVPAAVSAAALGTKPSKPAPTAAVDAKDAKTAKAEAIARWKLKVAAMKAAGTWPPGSTPAAAVGGTGTGGAPAAFTPKPVSLGQPRIETKAAVAQAGGTTPQAGTPQSRLPQVVPR